MRFEIRTGGWILIALGLLGLSVIVFAFGIYAGYDIARSTTPEAPQAASVYPLPNPPKAAEVAKAPVAAPQPTAALKSAAQKTKLSGPPSLAMDKDAGPVGAPSTRNVANAPASVPKVSTADSPLEEKPMVAKPAAPNPPAKYASDADSSGGHHKPFNIQIDAAMDRSNAEQMTARLQKLGYRAFMVPTDIAGQTWWRVRVGPYPSQEEASTAEQELREKYKDSYTP
jgi:cell division septation protein DedD